MLRSRISDAKAVLAIGIPAADARQNLFATGLQAIQSLASSIQNAIDTAGHSAHASHLMARTFRLGWSEMGSRLHTGATRCATLTRRWRHKYPVAGCGMGNLFHHGVGVKGSASIERARILHPLLPLTYKNAKSDEINESLCYVEVLLQLVVTRLPGTTIT